MIEYLETFQNGKHFNFAPIPKHHADEIQASLGLQTLRLSDNRLNGEERVQTMHVLNATSHFQLRLNHSPGKHEPRPRIRVIHPVESTLRE